MKNILIIVMSLSALLLFNSCKHNNFSDHVGPAICPSKDFHYLKPFNVGSSSNSKDLTQGPDTISAVFSEDVSWTLTLTGKSSGAQKIFSGHSDSVNVPWYGNSNSLTFFTTEDVNVELAVACLDPITKTITIAKANTFDNKNGSLYKQNYNFDGILISDFDGHGYMSDSTKMQWSPVGSPGYNNAGWSSFFDTTVNNRLTKFHIVTSPLSPPQGNHYLTVQGHAGPTSWFTGGVYNSAETAPIVGKYPFTDGDKTYFNAIISSGDNRTTLLTIVLTSSNIIYKYNLKIDWVGWKAVSIKLSDFIGAGVPMTDISKGITNVEFDLGPATQTGQSVELDIDFISLTPNESFWK